MLPIALNLRTISILLIGEGPAFDKRKQQLEAMGAQKVMSRESLVMGEVAEATIIMVAGLPYEASKTIAEAARDAGKLVNVEDVPELCDFTFTSFVQRGDLTIAVSTNGASPTLAKRVRDKISRMFGEEWSEHTEELKLLRHSLRRDGKSIKEVMDASDALIHEKGWLAA